MSEQSHQTSLTAEETGTERPPAPVEPDRSEDRAEEIAEQIEHGWPGEPTTS